MMRVSSIKVREVPKGTALRFDVLKKVADEMYEAIYEEHSPSILGAILGFLSKYFWGILSAIGIITAGGLAWQTWSTASAVAEAVKQLAPLIAIFIVFALMMFILQPIMSLFTVFRG